MAWDRLSPMGGERFDLLAAHVCMHLYAATHRGKSKSFQWSDYKVKWWEPPKRKPTQDELHKKLLGGFMAHNLRFAQRGGS